LTSHSIRITMKSFSAVALLSLPLGAFALTITSPAAGDTWNSTGDHTVTWTSDSSDPKEFGMYLINDNVKPVQVLPINDQVEGSTGSYTFPNVLPVGKDYQIRFNSLNAPGTNDTLTESGDFTIVSGGPNIVAVPSTSTTSTSTATGTAGLEASPTATGGTANSTPTGSSGSGTSEASSSGTTSSSTASATHKSSGVATYGSRGFAVAIGMVTVGFAAMFVVA
jgi:hypothetical protein